MAAFSDVFTNRWKRMQSCSVTTAVLQRASIMPRKCTPLGWLGFRTSLKEGGVFQLYQLLNKFNSTHG